MKYPRLASLLLAAFAAIAPVAAQAQSNANLIEVPKGQEKKIDRHLSCRLVKNTGAHPIMVATETRDEWDRGASSFLSNYQDIPGITVKFCPAEVSIVKADCGTITETKTIQSFFTAAEWTNVDQDKVLTIPASCNLCLNNPGSAALRVGTSGWGGDLTVIIKGTVSGASSNPGSRNNAINVNRLGAQGQKINITVDGGKVVAGGHNGANGTNAQMQTLWGTRCFSNVSSGWCNQISVAVAGGGGGPGGIGEHCGSAPTAGGNGFPGGSAFVPADSLRTWQQQVCTSQWVGGSLQQVCQWVTRYAVNQNQTPVTGPRGGNGAPGKAGTAGILNSDRAVIRVINGGHVRQ